MAPPAPSGTMVGAYWSPPAALRRIPSSCHWASAEEARSAEATMKKAKHRGTRVDMALTGSGQGCREDDLDAIGPLRTLACPSFNERQRGGEQ